MMDLSVVLPWVVALNSLITLAGGVYVFLTSGAKATATSLDAYKSKNDSTVDALIKAIAEQAGKMQILQAELTHLPNRNQVHELAMAIQKMSGQISTLDERLKPVAATSARIQNYLMERGAEK